MVRMTQRREEKRKEDKHCTRWKSGEEREVEAYTWCWWRPCRAPWLEEGRACPWGTPSAEQPRREYCAPRPAGRRRRGQTPRGAEGGDEKKREGGKWGGGGIKKHPLHFTMGIIFSEAAHTHAHSLPVGPASDLVDSTLKPVLQVRVFFFYLLPSDLWMTSRESDRCISITTANNTLSIHFSVFRLQMVANA